MTFRIDWEGMETDKNYISSFQQTGIEECAQQGQFFDPFQFY